MFYIIKKTVTTVLLTISKNSTISRSTISRFHCSYLLGVTTISLGYPIFSMLFVHKLAYDKNSYVRSCLAFDRILIKCGISTYLQSRRLIQAQKIDKRKKAFTTKMQWFLVVQFTMSLSAFLLWHSAFERENIYHQPIPSRTLILLQTLWIPTNYCKVIYPAIWMRFLKELGSHFQS